MTSFQVNFFLFILKRHLSSSFLDAHSFCVDLQIHSAFGLIIGSTDAKQDLFNIILNNVNDSTGIKYYTKWRLFGVMIQIRHSPQTSRGSVM